MGQRISQAINSFFSKLNPHQVQGLIELVTTKLQESIDSEFISKRRPKALLILLKEPEKNSADTDRKLELISEFLSMSQFDYTNHHDALLKVVVKAETDLKDSDRDSDNEDESQEEVMVELISKNESENYGNSAIGQFIREFPDRELIDESKEKIVRELIEIDTRLYVSEIRSATLRAILRDKRVDTDYKYKAVIAFMRHKDNINSAHTRAIVRVLESHDLAVDYKAHCAQALRSDDRNKVVKYIDALDHQDDYETNYLRAMFLKRGPAPSFQESYDCIKRAIQQLGDAENVSNKKEKLGRYRSEESKILHELLKRDQYYPKWLSSEPATRFSHSVNNMFATLGRDILCTVKPSILLSACDCQNSAASFLVGLSMAALAVVTVPVAAIVGTVHGIFRTKTRNPIDIVEQGQLCQKLQTFNKDDVSDEEKNLFFGRIIVAYEDTKTIAGSESSRDLVDILKCDEISVRDKVSAMNVYMLRREGQHLYNNGKRLFNIISDQLKSRPGNLLQI